jgi:hypothetical protein
VLNAALSCGKPAVIDCPVDYSENLRLSEHLKALGNHMGTRIREGALCEIRKTEDEMQG